jgi:hypothetical protein
VAEEPGAVKIRWESVVQSVVVALLVAMAVAAEQTYIEVKMLRKELDQLRVDVNDALQSQR